ncbi:MAG: hypothetical protein WDK96_03895 [Candidatus Paceibacterota bacterium]|jgi:hypothetical protein
MTLTGKIKLNTNIVNTGNLEKKVFRGLAISSGFLIALHVFLLCNTVFNVVERKTMEIESRNLSSQIGSLEGEYMSLNKTIDLSLASSLGFKESQNTSFASRQAFARNTLDKNGF